MKSTRWPTWKIAVTAAGCAVAAILLFLLSVFLEGVGGQADSEAGQPQALLSLPAFIMIMGVVAVMLSVLSTLWLGARIRESRIPPWERGRKKRKR